MAFSGGYLPVPVNHAKCGVANSSNFPVVVALTNANLKTIANGGSVADPNGYDVRPYPNTVPSGAYTYQLISYNGTLGRIVMVVLIATLDVATDVPINLFCGDAALNTDGSSTTVWDANVLTSHLLPNGTALTPNDHSAGVHNGIATAVTAASGPTLGGGTFDGATSIIALSPTINTTAMPQLIEGVAKKSVASSNGCIYGHTVGGNGVSLYVGNSGRDLILLKGGVVVVTWTNAVPNDALTHHYAVTMAGSGVPAIVAYVDGVAVAGTTNDGNTSALTSNAGRAVIGLDELQSIFWAGDIYAVRLHSSIRSPSWITASANNLLVPTTFTPAGTWVSLGGGGGGGGSGLKRPLTSFGLMHHDSKAGLFLPSRDIIRHRERIVGGERARAA